MRKSAKSINRTRTSRRRKLIIGVVVATVLSLVGIAVANPAQASCRATTSLSCI
jgi:hypothetical protein